MTHYTDANGRLSRFPTSYEHAIEAKTPFYDDGVKCTKCGTMSVKYTSDHKCRHCMRIDAGHFYNMSLDKDLVFTTESGRHFGLLAMGHTDPISDEMFNEMAELVELSKSDHGFTISPEPCKKKAHYGLKRLGKCYQCQQERLKPTPRQAAIAAGETWYTPTAQCLRCGTTSLRNVHNGACQGCTPPKEVSPTDSPRQTAIANGEKWYMPIDPCPKCDTVSLKRVDNGICQGCNPPAETDQRETPDSIMMRENPDMIISREDARAFDMKVYRTGNPCTHGHHAWRYVSTGNCIACLRTKGGE